jgi:hypothetical protein
MKLRRANAREHALVVITTRWAMDRSKVAVRNVACGFALSLQWSDFTFAFGLGKALDDGVRRPYLIAASTRPQ